MTGAPKGKEPKRIITLELIRKRAEHNEGLVSDLEEIALHQEELESIGPILGRTCGKTLKILLLQSNVIERMVPSELKLFRSLEYLNLALNNIQLIEGVNRMEFLAKLDLTLNFIQLENLEKSVDQLVACRSLENLFLIGNPCMGFESTASPPNSLPPSDKDRPVVNAPSSPGWNGCRPYIIARLPNLRSLDGQEIKRSERIAALQRLPLLTSELCALALARRQQLRKDHAFSGTNEADNDRTHDDDDDDDSDDDEVDESYIDDDEPTFHTPQTRSRISRELYHQKKAKETQENAHIAKPPKSEEQMEQDQLETIRCVREREAKKEADGSTNIKQCNQGKYEFWFDEDSAKGYLTMHIAVPKFMSSSLLDVDIHPTYVSVIIKSKILRVILPIEIISDESKAQRSAATGYLQLVMKKADPKGRGAATGIWDVVNRKDTQKNTLNHQAKFGTKDTNQKKEFIPKRKDRLGDSMLSEALKFNSNNVVETMGHDREQQSSNVKSTHYGGVLDDNVGNSEFVPGDIARSLAIVSPGLENNLDQGGGGDDSDDDDDDDGPPPLF